MKSWHYTAAQFENIGLPSLVIPSFKPSSFPTFRQNSTKLRLKSKFLVQIDIFWLYVSMEPKCEFLGQTRSKFDLWPQLYGSFLWIFKQSYFSLLINARKQILAIFGPNRNHMTVYMVPKCEFLGQIRSRYDLWPQLLRSILHIF